MDRTTVVIPEAELFAAADRLAAETAREGRPFVLLMLVPTSTQDQYSVVASAPWLDPLSFGEAFDYLHGRLLALLGGAKTAGARLIARINTIHSESEFVAAAVFRLRQDVGRIANARVGSTQLEETYVAVAGPPGAEIPQAVPLAQAAPEPVRRRKVG